MTISTCLRDRSIAASAEFFSMISKPLIPISTSKPSSKMSEIIFFQVGHPSFAVEPHSLSRMMLFSILNCGVWDKGMKNVVGSFYVVGVTSNSISFMIAAFVLDCKEVEWRASWSPLHRWFLGRTTSNPNPAVKKQTCSPFFKIRWIGPETFPKTSIQPATDIFSLYCLEPFFLNS